MDQTCTADEIIVVDDGSTDDTLEVLQPFKHSIKIVSQKNRGVSSARNVGIWQAKSKWIAFLDSDDSWDSEKLREQLDFHKNNPHILFSHTDECWIRNSKVISKKKHHQKPQGFCFLENIDFCKIGPSTVMINKAVFDKVGLFDENLEVCEDFDMWLRILKEYEIGFIDRQLTDKYAGHDSQLSFKYFAMDRFRILALEKHLKSQHQDAVKEMILKKCEILVKGAVKNKNQEIFEIYSKKLELYK